MEKRKATFLIIGAVLLGVIVLTAIATFILTRNIAQKNTGQNTSPVQADASSSGQRSLYVDLPADFPRDFPLFTDSRVTSSQSNKDQWNAVLLTDATTEEVAEFYTKELSTSKWKVADKTQAVGLTIYSVGKDAYQGIITIGKGDEGTTVSITILKS